MSTVVEAPVAVTTDGQVVLNLTAFDVPARLPAILAALRTVRGPFFVGVVLNGRERQQLQRDLGLVLPNVTGPIVGRRLRRAR